MGTITVPTVKGMGNSFGDYAAGAAGGLVFMLAQRMFGSGLIGSLIAPVLAGSVITGARGTALATVAGFAGISSLMAGSGSVAEPTDDNNEVI